jgi:hypothetical protein
MSTSARITRPQPARTEPIRSWSTVFGAAEQGSLEDAVSRSVELGYRVVDEYVRQGQRAAARFRTGAFAPDAPVRDVQDLTARMAQYASDFLAVWFEFVQLATAGGAFRTMVAPGDANGRPPGTPSPAPGAAVATASGDRTRVTIAVTSTQPVEVCLDLHPETAARPLVVHALRASDLDTPRLSEVALEPGTDDQPPRLRLHVPPGHPPGIYNGLVIDERTSRPVGTISVRVGAGA